MWIVKSKITKLRKIRIKSQLHYNVGARTQIPIFLIQSAGSNSTIIEAKQLHRRQSSRGIELEFSVCCPSSLPIFLRPAKLPPHLGLLERGLGLIFLRSNLHYSFKNVITAPLRKTDPAELNIWGCIENLKNFDNGKYESHSYSLN